jgi:hypothetical protein
MKHAVVQGVIDYVLAIVFVAAVAATIIPVIVTTH